MKRPRISLRGSLEGFAEKRGISTRLLILFIVLFVVAVTLAPPTQHYFAQRAQISALQADVESNRKKLEEARAELHAFTLYFQVSASTSFLALTLRSMIQLEQLRQSIKTFRLEFPGIPASSPQLPQ